MNKKFDKGFTLIELLVVVAIIGTLTAVVLIGVNNGRQAGRESAIVSLANNIRTSLEQYRAQNGEKYRSLLKGGILNNSNSSTYGIPTNLIDEIIANQNLTVGTISGGRINTKGEIFYVANDLNYGVAIPISGSVLESAENAEFICFTGSVTTGLSNFKTTNLTDFNTSANITASTLGYTAAMADTFNLNVLRKAFLGGSNDSATYSYTTTSLNVYNNNATAIVLPKSVFEITNSIQGDTAGASGELINPAELQQTSVITCK